MSIEQPKVSVLMPVYNTKEEYLREAIESILNQTFTDFEFIIFNDGSTNNAKEVILSYNDSRIKYYEHENQGIAKTTNKMFDLAKGKYIALMDSDDISLSNRLHIEFDYLESHLDVGVVSACYKVINSDIKYIIPEKEIIVRYMDLLKANQVPNINAFLRKEILEKFNLKIDENFDCAQDYEFWSRIIRYSKIVILEDILCLYRILPKSNSHYNIEYLKEMDKKIQHCMLDFLTTDKELQNNILELLHNKRIRKGTDLLKKIFSIKNYYTINEKYKIITILGIEIKLKRKR